jgi:hypothetical protein
MGGASGRALTGEIECFLSGLGGNADDVAASLRHEGVRGQPQDKAQCAIARYLGAVVGAETRVRNISVGTSELSVSGPHWWSAKLVVDVPPAIQQFIRAFDRYQYPDLVAPVRSAAAAIGPWFVTGQPEGTTPASPAAEPAEG